MRGRGLVPVVTALVVVATMFAAGAAPAERDGHYGGSIDTTTPAGGTNTVTSGELPSALDSVDVILGDTDVSGSTFRTLTFTLMQFRSKSKRAAACAVLALASLEYAQERLSERPLSSEDIDVIAQSRAAALAAVCLRLARLMSEIEAEQPTRPAHRAVRNQCDVAPVSLKVHVERTEDGQYRVTPAGHAKDGSRMLPATVTCQGRGKKATIHVQAKKHASLRKAMGPNVVLGVVSPSDATEEAHVKVGFRKG